MTDRIWNGSSCNKETRFSKALEVIIVLSFVPKVPQAWSLYAIALTGNNRLSRQPRQHNDINKVIKNEIYNRCHVRYSVTQ